MYPVDTSQHQPHHHTTNSSSSPTPAASDSTPCTPRYGRTVPKENAHTHTLTPLSLPPPSHELSTARAQISVYGGASLTFARR